MSEMSDVMKMALEFANDLHEVGAMKKSTLRDIEKLAVPKAPAYDAAMVRGIRIRYKISQPVFARILNVGPSTVQQWEQGKKKPSGASARLLDVIDRKGLEAIA